MSSKLKSSMWEVMRVSYTFYMVEIVFAFTLMQYLLKGFDIGCELVHIVFVGKVERIFESIKLAEHQTEHVLLFASIFAKDVVKKEGAILFELFLVFKNGALNRACKSIPDSYKHIFGTRGVFERTRFCGVC